MRQRFCKVCGEFHDLDEPWPAACFRQGSVARGEFPAPMVIGDNCEFMSTIDGTMVTSKRGWEKQVRAAGCEVVGNDKSICEPKPREYKPNEKALDEAIQKSMAHL